MADEPNKKKDLMDINGKPYRSPFSVDAVHVSVQVPAYQPLATKAERIACALYLVTDLLDIRDPLHGHIRSHGLDLVSGTIVPRTMSFMERLELLVSTLASIESLFGYLSIADQSQRISSMNIQMIRRELVGLHDALHTRMISLSESIQTEISNEDSYEMPFTLPQDFFRSTPTGSSVESNITTPVTAPTPDTPETPAPQRRTPSKTSPNIKSDRRNKILHILKDMKEVTIKDMAMRITNCSEKTIQRELNSMVDNGIITKEGEKRWTRYRHKS